MISIKNLRILYYFAETPSFMHQWQRVHFLDELQQVGCSISVYNPLNYSSMEEANEKLLEFLKENRNRFDLFFTGATSELLFPDTLTRIHETGIPSLLICFDNLHAPYIHQGIAPGFDLVWLTSQETIYLFKKWGCNTVFQPYAANPYKLVPAKGEEYPGIGFVGTLYDDRAMRLNQLTQSGVSCSVYSDSFSKGIRENTGKKLSPAEMLSVLFKLSKFNPGYRVAYGRILNKLNGGRNRLDKNDFLKIFPSVPFEKMHLIYSLHELSLNITELKDTFRLSPPVHKLHLRTYEIPMCGGLQIAPFTEELSSYFTDGQEIILCKSDEEFTEKSKFYLRDSNAGLRQKMKEQARKRAVAEHTWLSRFEKVIQKLPGS